MLGDYVRLLVVILSISATAAVEYRCNSASVCGCSTASVASVTAKIVGGQQAPNRVWEWIISLQKNRRHVCGASLLTAEFAVTAAHCVDDSVSDVASLSILAGTNFLDDSSSLVQRRTVSAIYIHPSYNSGTFLNDIALIRFPALTTGAQATLSFICLPAANQEPFNIGDDLIAIGWGVLSFGSSPASNALRQVTLQAVDSNAETCQRAPILDPGLRLCAGVSQGGKDTCQGDSGGPLMAFQDNRWVLAGITSSGIGCGLAAFSSLYTRVSNYVPYIQSILDSPDTATTAAPTTLTSTIGSGGNARQHLHPFGNIALFSSLYFLVILFIR